MANLDLTPKYQELQRLLEEDVETVLVVCPHILGDDYDELCRNLLALSEAGKTVTFVGSDACPTCNAFTRQAS